MADRVLTLGELNRTTLARQMLLERAEVSVPDAVKRLIALQAQIPNPPYIGLWTRLRQFQRDDLTRLMEQRQIVRAAMMRSTLHLTTAADHQRFRPAIQPALTRALNAFFGKRAKDLNIEKLVDAARPFLHTAPRSTGDLRNLLSEIEPDADPDALAYLVRTYIPLIQVPPAGTWGSGSMAAYVTAEAWLGQDGAAESVGTLFLRYLAAFGPASIMDFQTWSGLVNLKSLLAPLKAQLRLFRDAQGKELLDLPDMPLYSAETPAPVRFIPEYDNLLLAHADRTRIIADAYRPKVFLSAARVQATFLVDGFVRGAWKIQRTKGAARLVIEPFAPLSDADRAALIDEGERLLHFVEADAKAVDTDFKSWSED